MTHDDPDDRRAARRRELTRIARTPDDQLTEEELRRKYPFRITVEGAPLEEQSRMFYESMLREPLTLPEDPELRARRSSAAAAC